MENPNKTYAIFDKQINKHIIDKIESKRNEVFKFPSIETLKNDLTESENQLIKNVGTFDWLIFTDVFAVNFFIEELEHNGVDLFELDNLRICAYGESVADRLRFVQIHSDVIANKIDDFEIFEQIKNYLFDEDELFNLKVILIKNENRNFEISETFANSKSDLITLNIYQTEKIQDALKLKTLTLNGAFDEFVLTSVEDITELSNLFYTEKMNSLLKDISLSVTDEMTFHSLREFDLQPTYFEQKK